LSHIQFVHITLTPVLRHFATGKQDEKEDDESTESKTDIQGSGGEVVVPHPPTAVGVTDPFVEDKTKHAPRQLQPSQSPSSRRETRSRAFRTYNVHRGKRGNVGHAGKYKWYVDPSDEGNSWEHASKAVNEERTPESSKPKPLEVFVDGNVGEQMLGTDSTPDNTRVVEGLNIVAGEGACGRRGADTLDGSQGPLNGGKLPYTRPSSGSQLCSKE
jgi:hypothetical protein